MLTLERLHIGIIVSFIVKFLQSQFGNSKRSVVRHGVKCRQYVVVVCVWFDI